MKYTEWQSASGNWYSGDVTDLAHGSNFWWHPARMLNMELTDYILWLKNEFNAYSFFYNPESNILLWKWKKEDCHKFTLFINKKARQYCFKIC